MESLSKGRLKTLKDEIDSTIADLKIEEKKSTLGELQTTAAQEGFWNDQDTAKKVMRELEGIRKEIETSKHLQDSITSLIELYDSVSKKERESLIEEFTTLQEEVDSFQTLKFLSGKYDNADVILSIHSGQGGTEANDWAQMLLRMYTRYVEKQGWKLEQQHLVPGGDAGISTVTLLIEGPYAFGLLKNEAGTHRLVRQSPFNAQNLRQTSFAGVEVTPVIEDDEEIEIPEADIEFKAVRSSGAGGQSVNKTSSAVQIRHLPTGIMVKNSQQKSQLQNRKAAMKILKAKLWQIKEESKAKEMSDLKGEHKVAAWGNQIRNYVLHPYKLVKDLRTNVESSNPDSVLDGELTPFIDAEIRMG